MLPSRGSFIGLSGISCLVGIAASRDPCFGQIPCEAFSGPLARLMNAVAVAGREPYRGMLSGRGVSSGQ